MKLYAMMHEFYGRHFFYFFAILAAIDRDQERMDGDT